MTGGEMAYLTLVLSGFALFGVVLFWVSGGFGGGAPTRAPAKLPVGGVEAGA